MASVASSVTRKSWKRRSSALLALALGCLVTTPLPTPLEAQTLAHSRWAGSGLSADPWWRNAVIYQLDPLTFQDSNGDGFGDLAGITQRLDYLQSLNVDAILLSPLNAVSAAAGAPPALDPVYGAPGDFDNLLQAAIQRRIRVIVDLPVGAARPAAETTSLARFWFSRGVAGLRLVRETTATTAMSPADVSQLETQLRSIAAGFGGQRVLLSDPSQNVPTTAAPLGLTLTPLTGLMEHLSGTELRRQLQDAQRGAPVIFTDSPEHPRSPDRYGDAPHNDAIARLLAVVLLTTRTAPMIFYGQEIGVQASGNKPASRPDHEPGETAPALMQWGGTPGFTKGTPWIAPGANAANANVTAEDPESKSLLGWYRALSSLHHNNPAMNGGTLTLLETKNPDVVAWERKQVSGAPVVVVVNLAGHPSEASLPELKAGFLRSVLASVVIGTYMAPVRVTGFSLPGYGVYVGELGR